MTRAERDTKIASLRLTITLADGVREDKVNDAYADAEAEIEIAKNARERRVARAERAFDRIEKEVEAEIARLEGLEVTE